MSSEKTNNSGSEVQNASTFSSIIAQASKMGIKIRDINKHFTDQYKINPMLVLLPFTAGVVASVTFFGSDGSSSSNNLDVNIAALGGGGSVVVSQPDNSIEDPNMLTLTQADLEDDDLEKLLMEDEDAGSNLDFSEDVMNDISPEEQQIFDLFTQMAEIQASQGEDSPEVEAIGDKLDVLIEKVRVRQEEKEEAELKRKAAEKAPTPAVKDRNENKGFRTRPFSKPTTKDKAVKTPPQLPIIPAKDKPVATKPVKTVSDLQGPPKPTIPAKKVPDSHIPGKTSSPEPVKTEVKEVTKRVPATTDKVENQEPAQVDNAVEDTTDVLEEGKIRIKTNDGVIDLNELLIAIGKELELNYYFEDGSIPTGKIMLQQYGAIDREELLPLLESVLAKSDYMMVKEGPYTKIVKRNEVHKNTTIFSPDLDENYEELQDSVAATIVTLKYVDHSQVTSILDKFVPYTDIITPIENTNKIVITDYARNLARIQDIIEMIDVPGPKKELLIITPDYLKPDDTKAIIEDMYNKLYGESGISTSSAATPAVPEGPLPAEEIARMSPSERGDYLQSRRDAANAAKPGSTPKVETSIPVPDITVDKRTGRMFIIGTKQELANVKSILTLFDVPKSGPQAKWEIHTPTYVDSKNVVEQIKTLMKAMNEVDSGMNADGEDSPVTEPVAVTPPQSNRPNRGSQNTQDNSSSNDIQGMFIHVDERTNRIIVLGWPDQIDLFKELLGLFDVPLPGGEIELEIIGLENTEAGDTLGKVKELINAINKQSSGKAQGSDNNNQQIRNTRRIQNRAVNIQNQNQNQNSSSASSDEEDSGPFMLADERLNRIFIIGVREQIDQAKDLTAMIDQQWPGSKVRLEIFNFDVVEVEAITEQITQLIEALNAGENSDTTSSGVDKRRSQNNFPGMGNQPISSGNNNNSSQTNSFQQAGEEGPFLMADSRLNRLFVVGLDDQIEQVDELIKMLDKSIGLDLNIFPAFKYILSSEAADQIAKLMSVLHEQEAEGGSGSSSRNTRSSSSNRNSYNRTNSNDTLSGLSGRSSDRSSQDREGISSMISVSQRGPFLLPDDRTNRLLIVSTKDQYNEVLSLIPILDVPPSKYDEMTIEVYQPQYVTVSEVQTILDELGLTQSSASLDEQYRRRSNTNQTNNNNRNNRNNRTNNNTIFNNNDQISGIYSDYTMVGNVEEPEIYVAIHENTNRLFIYAAKYQHEEIKRMVDKIDIEPDNNMGDYEVFSVKHRKPDEIAGVLTQLLVDNEKPAGEAVQEEIEGKAVIVAVTDTPYIVVRANQQKREQVSRLIDELDKAMPQVLIEARFVQISLDDSFRLGVGMQNNFETGSNGSVSGMSPLNLSEISTNSNNVAVGDGGTVAFFQDGIIHATLEAISSKTNSEVTSSPRLLVNNNSEATFTSTKQKPTTKTTLPAGSDTPITEFDQYVEAGTTLTITPQIGVSDKDAAEDEASLISLDITVNVDSFDGEGSNGIPPGKSNNSITTNVSVPDGATIILGGLTQTNWSDSVNKIPLLGDIPGVGVLFRNTTKSKSKTVLYLFIKATVAFDPNKTPNFEKLKEISRVNHEEMIKLRESFNGMPVIPGFNDGEKEAGKEVKGEKVKGKKRKNENSN